MAGIYLHIPYCKVKCHYCDFHFSIQTNSVSDMLQTLLTELEQRKSYLESEEIETIYFGGGTPSYFPVSSIQLILQKIQGAFSISPEVEITLEANPDDISKESLTNYASMGINRLSIGVQSFDDAVLTFMNRAHNSKQIKTAIEQAKEEGFENITVDLMYGIPGKTMHYWKDQLEQFIKLDVPHLSSYCLTIEPNTVFGFQQKKGELIVPADDEALQQFQYLMDFAKSNQLDHYEISNFAKEGFISKHNSNYWLGKKYLGIGPSAHSYNGTSRSWNIANNLQYIKLIQGGEPYWEEENLDSKSRCNDYIMTRLRTKWGIDLRDLNFISEKDLALIQTKITHYIQKDFMVQKGYTYCLTDKGKYRADGIAADLFLESPI